MKTLTLALAAAGAIALSVPAPASAAQFTGLRAPLVDSAGAVEVQRRCWHRPHSSRWRCHRGHHHRWESRRWGW